MTIFSYILVAFLIVCAVAVCLNKNLLTSIVIFMSYSVIMCIIWILLESPDLAITEAAVGAGVTSLLFFMTLKKIHALTEVRGEEEPMWDDEEGEDESAENGKIMKMDGGGNYSVLSMENAWKNRSMKIFLKITRRF